MEVTITKKHTEGAEYIDTTDCPLARAISEKYPELEGKISVGGWDVSEYKDKVYEGSAIRIYSFDHTQWNKYPMSYLQNGTIGSVTLKLELHENFE